MVIFLFPIFQILISVFSSEQIKKNTLDGRDLLLSRIYHILSKVSLSNQLQTQFTVCVVVGGGFPSDTHDDEGRWALIGAGAAAPLPAAAVGWLVVAVGGSCRKVHIFCFV